MDIVEVWIIEGILSVHCFCKQKKKDKKMERKRITKTNYAKKNKKLDILENLEHISSGHVKSSPL